MGRPRHRDEPKVTVSFSLDRAIVAGLDKRAEQTGRSRSLVVSDLITTYILQAGVVFPEVEKAIGESLLRTAAESRHEAGDRPSDP